VAKVHISHICSLLFFVPGVVSAKWDTMSGSQTRKLVNVIYRLVHEWSVSPNSKSMHTLLSTVVTKFNDAVSNDVFTPIYPKTYGS